MGLHRSLNQNTKYNICFVRHGQSTWNRDNRFIGWTDTPLTDDGKIEAKIAGQLLADSSILFDEVHTSLLSRSIETAHIILQEMKQHYIPMYKHYRLNERNYGNLVGYNKKDMVMKYGKEQIKRWRRSYDEPPPPMSHDHKYHPKHDIRYQNILQEIPESESLKCTVERASVYWDNVIVPRLQSGRTILVVGHENNLRAILMKLDNVSKEDIIDLSLPRAVPLLYQLDLTTCKPYDDPLYEHQRDSVSGLLRGMWLGGDSIIKSILQRDEKQVYDTSVQENLELHTRNKINQRFMKNGSSSKSNSTNNVTNNNNLDDYWRAWMETASGKTSSPSTTSLTSM